MTASAGTRLVDDAPIRYAVDDGVAIVTLNRPQRRNAWTAAMETAYFERLDAAGHDPAVRAIVITGAGDTFCPGLDPEALSASVEGLPFAADRRPQSFVTTVPKPVIAAVNGNCAGIGLTQAMYCDVRFIDRAARLSTAFSRRGLPAEDGTSWLLGHLVGHAKALELLLSARVFSADEAYALGLAHEVVEHGRTLDRALAYARDLAANVSPHSMKMIKEQIYRDLGGSLEPARLRAVDLIALAKRHPDYREGVRSWLEKRPARFLPHPSEQA